MTDDEKIYLRDLESNKSFIFNKKELQQWLGISELEKEFNRCMKDITLSLNNNFKRIEKLEQKNKTMLESIRAEHSYIYDVETWTENLDEQIAELEKKIEKLEDVVSTIGVKTDFTSNESGQALREIVELENKFIADEHTLLHIRENTDRIEKLEKKFEMNYNRIQTLAQDIIPEQVKRLEQEIAELKEQYQKVYDALDNFVIDAGAIADSTYNSRLTIFENVLQKLIIGLEKDQHFAFTSFQSLMQQLSQQLGGEKSMLTTMKDDDSSLVVKGFPLTTDSKPSKDITKLRGWEQINELERQATEIRKIEGKTCGTCKNWEEKYLSCKDNPKDIAPYLSDFTCNIWQPKDGENTGISTALSKSPSSSQGSISESQVPDSKPSEEREKNVKTN